MSNHYKRMFVLTEEEYNRLKLKLENIPPTQRQQQQQYGSDHTVTAAANTANVENTPTAHELHEPLPPLLLPQQITSTPRYSCPICGKSYKQKRDLMRHVKLRHGITPPTRAIIPPSAIIIEKKKQQKKKKKTTTSFHVFDKVKKWMTIRG